MPDARDEPPAPPPARVDEPPAVQEPAPAPPPAPVEAQRPGPQPAPPLRPAPERVPSPPPRRRRRRAAPAPSATPTLDLAALLRDHVVPALVDRGALGRDERPIIAEPASAATARRHEPPRPGTVAVRATPATAAAAAGHEPEELPARDADPAVHLHIDQVLVTRAPPPAPPPPAPAPRAARRTVDHAAYLARRRERP
jgi:hypothetical protein